MRNIIIFCIMMIIIMNTDANEIKEAIITYYEIEYFKMLLDKTKIEYDEKGREKREISYVKPWGFIRLGAITIYEYPDANTKVKYFNSIETRAYKIIYKYDINKNLIYAAEYISDKVEIPLKEWEVKYREYYYEKHYESIYEYNDKYDLILAKSLFGSLYLYPIEDLPFGHGSNIEELKYIYNDKNQKISVFGSKDNKTNEYIREWKYYYDSNNNLIKIEKYVRDELLSYYIYKYDENNLLIEEIAHSVYFYVKENKIEDKIIQYFSYEYYSDGRLKRKNLHNHMKYEKIEEMKIYAYEEYIYK